MEQKKIGSSTTTYKLRLYQKHLDWLQVTKELYNSVLAFYYEILLKNEELLIMSNHSLMRELEILTVGTKQMKNEQIKPKYSLDSFPKLPLYFRRAIINNAISLVRSYQKNLENWKQHEESYACPSKANQFHASPLYYKGMYKDFTENSICLKLYNGEKWKWVTYHYTGRSISNKTETLSPSIKIGKKDAWLHVPVLETVEDIRTIEERMKTEEKVAAISFPGSDTMAVCSVINKEGKELASCFIRGGEELKAKKKKICKKIEKVRKSRGDKEKIEEKAARPEHIYFQKIEKLNEEYAHRVSKKIIDFVLQQEVKVIAIPNYEQEIDFKKMRFLKAGEYDWIGRKIIRFLKYKAYQRGIVIGTIRPYHISDTCSICGAVIQKYNEGYKPHKNYYGGKLFLCPNGHKGNSAQNAARNIGKKFLERYQN